MHDVLWLWLSRSKLTIRSFACSRHSRWDSQEGRLDCEWEVMLKTSNSSDFGFHFRHSGSKSLSVVTDRRVKKFNNHLKAVLSEKKTKCLRMCKASRVMKPKHRLWSSSLTTDLCSFSITGRTCIRLFYSNYIIDSYWLQDKINSHFQKKINQLWQTLLLSYPAKNSSIRHGTSWIKDAN